MKFFPSQRIRGHSRPQKQSNIMTPHYNHSILTTPTIYYNRHLSSFYNFIFTNFFKEAIVSYCIMNCFWRNAHSYLTMSLPTYPLTFFFVKARNIYQLIIELGENKTNITRASFSKSLSYPLCLHCRTIN